MATTNNARITLNHTGSPAAANAPLRDLMKVMFCSSASTCGDTAPVAASCRSSFPMVLRILEERPEGQKTTSKPPPEGMMKVDVWSSNARKKTLLSEKLSFRSITSTGQGIYHNCRHQDKLSWPGCYSRSACTRSDYHSDPHSSRYPCGILRTRNSMGRKAVAELCHPGMDRRHPLVCLAHRVANPRGTSSARNRYSGFPPAELGKSYWCRGSRLRCRLSLPAAQRCRCR